MANGSSLLKYPPRLRNAAAESPFLYDNPHPVLRSFSTLRSTGYCGGQVAKEDPQLHIQLMPDKVIPHSASPACIEHRRDKPVE